MQDVPKNSFVNKEVLDTKRSASNFVCSYWTCYNT